MFELKVHLFDDGQDTVRQQAAQMEGVALAIAEGQVLGEEAAAEQGRAGERDAGGPASCDIVERSGKRTHACEDSRSGMRGGCGIPVAASAALHDDPADHPVGLVTGQVADEQVRTRCAEGDGRDLARAGRDGDLGRA